MINTLHSIHVNRIITILFIALVLTKNRLMQHVTSNMHHVNNFSMTQHHSVSVFQTRKIMIFFAVSCNFEIKLFFLHVMIQNWLEKIHFDSIFRKLLFVPFLCFDLVGASTNMCVRDRKKLAKPTLFVWILWILFSLESTLSLLLHGCFTRFLD